jgi:hypothetical protein
VTPATMLTLVKLGYPRTRNLPVPPGQAVLDVLLSDLVLGCCSRAYVGDLTQSLGGLTHDQHVRWLSEGSDPTYL